MAIDLYQTRRDKFYKCRYWIARDSNAFKDLGLETIRRDNGYKISQECDGTFYAKDLNGERIENKEIENVMRFKRVTAQLLTTDRISDILPDSIVEFKGKYWRVVDIQIQEKKRQTEFLSNTSCTYILGLVR